MNHYLMTLLVAMLGSSGAWALNGTISGSGTEADPYLLEDAADWTEFANAAYAASYWGSDVYVKMTADIGTTDGGDLQSPVTTMIGTSDKPFCGHFDGDGKTLTVNLTEGASYVAPFS